MTPNEPLVAVIGVVVTVLGPDVVENVTQVVSAKHMKTIKL